MSWTWECRLVQLGGKLLVTPDAYSTSVYFPGIDRRHNGTFWSMTAGQIVLYMAALEDAWARFEQISKLAVQGADTSASGRMQIGIHVGAWPGRGITLHGHNALISTKGRLDGLIRELRSLPGVAERVQVALRDVSV